MTPADRQAFCEIVVAFAELKGKQLSAPAIELYWRSLQHWHIEDFKAAAEELLRACTFLPLPKDFEDLRKASRPTTGEAWARVIEHVRHGSYRASALDGHTERVMRMIGGWQVVAHHPLNTLHFLERRFAEHYEALQDAEDTRAAVPHLAQLAAARLSRA